MLAKQAGFFFNILSIFYKSQLSETRNLNKSKHKELMERLDSGSQRLEIALSRAVNPPEKTGDV